VDGACKAAPRECPTPFACLCPFGGGGVPVCGTTDAGGNCGCFSTVEGNNICVNQGLAFADLATCQSSEECGPGFVCRAVVRCITNMVPCGSDVSRCWPTCDNPAV
jgi:hypothetical protein